MASARAASRTHRRAPCPRRARCCARAVPKLPPPKTATCFMLSPRRTARCRPPPTAVSSPAARSRDRGGRCAESPSPLRPPSAASTNEALARRSVAITVVPERRSTPWTTAWPPSTRISAPSRLSSATCMKRFSKIFSVTTEAPWAPEPTGSSPEPAYPWENPGRAPFGYRWPPKRL